MLVYQLATPRNAHTLQKLQQLQHKKHYPTLVPSTRYKNTGYSTNRPYFPRRPHKRTSLRGMLCFLRILCYQGISAKQRSNAGPRRGPHKHLIQRETPSQIPVCGATGLGAGDTLCPQRVPHNVALTSGVPNVPATVIL